MLSFAEFKKKIAEFKKKVAEARARAAKPKGAKLSQTQLRRIRRAMKTQARAACDSFRYRQKHQHELAAARKRAQNERRTARKAEALV